MIKKYLLFMILLTLSNNTFALDIIKCTINSELLTTSSEIIDNRNINLELGSNNTIYAKPIYFKDSYGNDTTTFLTLGAKDTSSGFFKFNILEFEIKNGSELIHKGSIASVDLNFYSSSLTPLKLNQAFMLKIYCEPISPSK